jgi:hypothetical protein
MDKDEALKLALEALEAALSDDQPYIDKSQEAITAIKQARALDKKAENTMIYRTFEQWKSGNVLEHGVPRTEYYSEDQLDLVEMGWNYGYDAGRAVEQALDKKAENARELGLDYEPVAYIRVSKTGHVMACAQTGDFYALAHGTKLYTTPPAQPAPAPEGRDWSLLEATQESLREHMSEIKRLKAAPPAVPDAIGPNEDELPAYVAGWNDCRQAMLEMMK